MWLLMAELYRMPTRCTASAKRQCCTTPPAAKRKKTGKPLYPPLSDNALKWLSKRGDMPEESPTLDTSKIGIYFIVNVIQFVTKLVTN